MLYALFVSSLALFNLNRWFVDVLPHKSSGMCSMSDEKNVAVKLYDVTLKYANSTSFNLKRLFFV